MNASVPLNASTSPLMDGWQGLSYNTESRLWNNLARQYNQNTGTFRSQDPLGIMGGINLYGSRGNNSLAYLDPDGMIMRKPGSRMTENENPFNKFFGGSGGRVVLIGGISVGTILSVKSCIDKETKTTETISTIEDSPVVISSEELEE